MLVFNYIILFVILISLGILYQKFLEKQSKTASFDEYDEIKKYLLNDKTLDKSKKPLLWIHIPYELNARDWLSFGSRNSTESFNIILIDDNTFKKLIPDCNININILSDPMKCYIRQLCIAKLIYRYGGMNVPISFLCFKNLISLYNKGTNNDTMFVCENYDLNIT